MIVGVPREIKEDEYRVALLPGGVEELTRAGHRVLVERGAGSGAGFTDREYECSGAELLDGPHEVFGAAELIVKVKEPQPSEVPLLRRGQLLFTYLHVHYAVANMPGAVGRTSTLALCHATERYVLCLATRGLERAAHEDPALATAVNLHRGVVTHPAVAETFSLEHTPFAA